MRARLKLYEVIHNYEAEPFGFDVNYVATDMKVKDLKRLEKDSSKYSSIKVKRIGTINVNLERKLIEMDRSTVKIHLKDSILRELMEAYARLLK